MSNKMLIVYHGGCTDGFTAAWCAQTTLGTSADYMEMKNDGADFPVDGREVVFLDCCPRREQLLEFKRRAKSVLVLDHHISNAKENSDIEGCVFDMEKSGAGMAADRFLDPRGNGWKFVQYVQDSDLWQHRLPESRVVSGFLFSHPFSFETWDTLAQRFEDDFDGIVLEGQGIKRKHDVDSAYLKAKVVPMTICGFEKVPVINMAHGDISGLLNELAKTAPNHFAIAWHHAGPGKFKYSIRSSSTFDCAHFANHNFGGGGHLGAAAWTCPWAPWELSISPAIFRKSQ